MIISDTFHVYRQRNQWLLWGGGGRSRQWSTLKFQVQLQHVIVITSV